MKFIKLTVIGDVHTPESYSVWINPQHITFMSPRFNIYGEQVEGTEVELRNNTALVVKESPEWIAGVLEDVIKIYSEG